MSRILIGARMVFGVESTRHLIAMLRRVRVGLDLLVVLVSLGNDVIVVLLPVLLIILMAISVSFMLILLIFILLIMLAVVGVILILVARSAMVPAFPGV